MTSNSLGTANCGAVDPHLQSDPCTFGFLSILQIWEPLYILSDKPVCTPALNLPPSQSQSVTAWVGWLLILHFPRFLRRKPKIRMFSDPPRSRASIHRRGRTIWRLRDLQRSRVSSHMLSPCPHRRTIHTLFRLRPRSRLAPKLPRQDEEQGGFA